MTPKAIGCWVLFIECRLRGAQCSADSIWCDQLSSVESMHRTHLHSQFTRRIGQTVPVASRRCAVLD